MSTNLLCNMVQAQIGYNFKNLTNDLLNKETKIISKNGKYYYLTE